MYRTYTMNVTCDKYNDYERKFTMEHRFIPRGVCAREITFEVEDGKLKNVNFYGGCNGNLKGIAALVEGLSLEEVRDKLKDIRCGHKATSCPDQLAIALNQILEANE